MPITLKSRVKFYGWLSLDDTIALFADVAGRALALGRPAALVRQRFEKRYDHNRLGNDIGDTDGWPGIATYAGDGATIDVETYTIEESGNPHDGWGYSAKVVLAFAPPRKGRVILNQSGSSLSGLMIDFDVEDDPDASLFDITHALTRARVGAAAEDLSKRRVTPP